MRNGGFAFGNYNHKIVARFYTYSDRKTKQQCVIYLARSGTRKKSKNKISQEKYKGSRVISVVTLKKLTNYWDPYNVTWGAWGRRREEKTPLYKAQNKYEKSFAVGSIVYEIHYWLEIFFLSKYTRFFYFYFFYHFILSLK